jgi:hypothetical protein
MNDYCKKLKRDSRRFETAVSSQSNRLRIFRKPDFINLVHRVGHIRLASRHQQFKGVRKFEIPCLNIVDLHPLLVTWRAFDADGSVTLTVNKSKTESSMSGIMEIHSCSQGVYCQLSLHIVSKDANVLYEVKCAQVWKNIS